MSTCTIQTQLSENELERKRIMWFPLALNWMENTLSLVVSKQYEYSQMSVLSKALWLRSPCGRHSHWKTNTSAECFWAELTSSRRAQSTGSVGRPTGGEFTSWIMTVGRGAASLVAPCQTTVGQSPFRGGSHCGRFALIGEALWVQCVSCWDITL